MVVVNGEVKGGGQDGCKRRIEGGGGRGLVVGGVRVDVNREVKFKFKKKYIYLFFFWGGEGSGCGGGLGRCEQRSEV